MHLPLQRKGFFICNKFMNFQSSEAHAHLQRVLGTLNQQREESNFHRWWREFEVIKSTWESWQRSCEWVIGDLGLAELPLSFRESTWWKYFCNKVNLYKPHSKRTATTDIVEMFLKNKALKKWLYTNQQRVSFTADIWVSQVTCKVLSSWKSENNLIFYSF